MDPFSPSEQPVAVPVTVQAPETATSNGAETGALPSTAVAADSITLAQVEAGPEGPVVTDLSSRLQLSKPIFLAGALILATVGTVAVMATQPKDPKASKQAGYSSQQLGALDGSGQKEGSGPFQTLTVNSGSVFNGNITANKDLNLKGKLTTDGPLDVTGLNASGPSNLQGGLNVANFLNLSGTLSVTGNGSFGGDITANTITARNSFNSGVLNITGHLVTSGATPIISGGGALGGGSVRISGNDSVGTIILNTGAAPAAEGDLATIAFRAGYGNYPKIILTPVGPNGARLGVYTSRNPGSFAIGTITKPSPNTQYVFDYIIAQ